MIIIRKFNIYIRLCLYIILIALYVAYNFAKITVAKV